MNTVPIRNDEAVLQELFEQVAMPHINDLYFDALQYTKNEQDAQDLLQETYLKAYANFHRFEQGTNCKAWLFTILKNTFINKFRRTKKERQIFLSDDALDVEHNLFDRSQANFYLAPEYSIQIKALSSDVKQALASLPYEFRVVVILTDLNDFSYKEVAYILDCPLGTVMSRLFRGRKMMRRSLTQLAFDQGIIRTKALALHEGNNRIRRTSKALADKKIAG